MNEHIVFGGGCFWCTEAVFENLKGVISITPGYTGGETENPTYEDICTGKTGHVEVISIHYNPQEISFANLLSMFFATHDATTLNRQGADIGTQYRSAIFYTNEEQRLESISYIQSLNESSLEGDPVITEVSPLSVFYEAEEYHKKYYDNNPQAGYCQIVISPKLEKAQKEFAHLLKIQNDK